MEPLQKLPLIINNFRRHLHKLLHSKSPQNQSKHFCPMSDPVKPHKLRRVRDGSQLSVCFGCKGKHLEGKRYYYFCSLCMLEFHRGCHALPQQMEHPLHLSHPLTLISLDPNFDTSKIPQEWREFSSSDSEAEITFVEESYRCADDMDDDSYYDSYDNDDSCYHYDSDGYYGDSDNYVVDDDDSDCDDDPSSSDIYYGKCKCCQKRFEDVYYHCSDCNFSLNFTCTIKPPPLSITHLKSHNHTLTLFPRRIPLPCDVCGLSLNDADDPVYACLPCNYMVHRECITLPRVIKITRHQHRLYLISSLLSGDFSCGVCRKTIDVSYGHYSCNKGCCYGVHSKCSTNGDVWDGVDLEDEPEEPEEDIEPFDEIDEETIKHFTHDCHLKLQGKGSLIHGAKKFCKACCIEISTFDVFYSCVDCEFVLHEDCARLPRIKHHPLHKHPLTLLKSNPLSHCLPSIHYFEGMFECDACHRMSSGFVYKCDKCGFCKLDVKCASLPDTLIHESHPNHPLYINLNEGDCMGCKASCADKYLECMVCNSYLGVSCATLPSVAHYKHDSHPLTLCFGEKDTTSGQYWCEICEKKLDASEWFYTCDTCRVTLHVKCLLGIDMYMKPQHFLKRIGGGEVEIAHNDTEIKVSVVWFVQLRLLEIRVARSEVRKIWYQETNKFRICFVFFQIMCNTLIECFNE